MHTDWFSFWSEITPDHTAIIDISTGHPNAFTFAEINDISSKIVSYFRTRKIEKGDRIVILSENCIEYIYLFGTAQKCGVVLVPLNYRLAQLELELLIDEIQPKIILAQEKYTSILSRDYELLSHFMTEVKSCKQLPEENILINEDDPLLILYTSGSSGKPKGAIYTHKMSLWNSLNTNISLGLNSKSKTVICMPPFHTGGWNVLLTPIIHAGGCCILTPTFEVKDILSYLEDYNCTIFMAVPTMLKMMVEEPLFWQTDFTSIDYFIVGGEAMSKELIETYHKRGIFIRQGYGMTEVGPNLTSLHHSEAIRKIGSIGKPNMYVQIKIVNDKGDEVSINETGELLLRGPNLTPGYYKQPEQTRAAIRNGWFHTGDIVVQDAEGFLYLVDRIKNMYISGGENVYPAEVERLLLHHESIQEVIVIGIPDSKWGETGLAIVVSKEGKPLTIDELREYCQGKIAKYKIPRHIKCVDQLPKSDTGKINRRRLKELYHRV